MISINPLIETLMLIVIVYVIVEVSWRIIKRFFVLKKDIDKEIKGLNDSNGKDNSNQSNNN